MLGPPLGESLLYRVQPVSLPPVVEVWFPSGESVASPGFQISRHQARAARHCLSQSLAESCRRNEVGESSQRFHGHVFRQHWFVVFVHHSKSVCSLLLFKFAVIALDSASLWTRPTAAAAVFFGHSPFHLLFLFCIARFWFVLLDFFIFFSEQLRPVSRFFPRPICLPPVCALHASFVQIQPSPPHVSWAHSVPPFSFVLGLVAAERGQDEHEDSLCVM